MGRHFRPSEAARWIACPGSVALCERLPRPDAGPAALLGTAAHRLAEHCLRNGEVSADSYVREKCDVTGIAYTAEMADAVDVYLDEVWQVAGNPANRFYVESEFTALSLDGDTFGGTSDCVVVAPSVLYVFDYKNGAGVAVDVENNKQLLSYALAQVRKFEAEGEHFDKIVLTVVQPRCSQGEAVKRWECTPFELVEFEMEARAAIVEARSPGARFKPGKHCTFCPAKKFAQCPTLNAAESEIFAEVVPPPTFETFSPVELGERLRRAEAVSEYITAIKKFAEDEARKGNMPSGYKWVIGSGRRGWCKADGEIIAAIKEKHGADVAAITCPGPAAVEKIIGKKVVAEMFGDLITKSPGKPKLVTEAHKGAAVTLADVNRASSADFEDVD